MFLYPVFKFSLLQMISLTSYISLKHLLEILKIGVVNLIQTI